MDTGNFILKTVRYTNKDTINITNGKDIGTFAMKKEFVHSKGILKVV
ncbi:hypothetical protein ACOCEA_16830 [Maribacter sp. CXY002]